ncbi:YfhO family protein [Ulvibacterium sp.]|uniref:YfhO family protein n=1 Tax=Ulvibacterium sp. TaxID=2665914 RepID=UPI002615BF06|nr:YfhO family protein [Ulvibacterium sp.]
MKNSLKALFTHFFVTVFFVVVALTYFHPVLQGKVIEQSDIIQFTGMAKEQNDFRKRTGEEPYWTNSAFGGMPTYQLGAYYPHDYVKKLDRLIRFLPRPADYLFLYFIGFYILLSCLKVEYRLAILGALAFGFSTYLIIILGVGHNAKAHAMGYLPILLGGIVLTFRKKYLWGFVLTAIAMALEVVANHYQMTYYGMLLILILGLVYLVYAIKKKQVKHFFVSVGILVMAVVLGIAANATSLMATKEYADWSTRGKSELTVDYQGNPKENLDGLDKEYITRWSYGISESMNLFVPRLFGGSSQENLGEDSKTYGFLIDQGIPRGQALAFSSGIALYWGNQPGTSGPAYIGAIVFFLFVLGLILVKGKSKWWLLGATLLSLFLSWGKNLSFLTDFMIDYFPLYDKFRAVSSIQVILELCAPILAILALQAIFKDTISKADKIKALRTSFFIVFGFGILLFLVKGMFDFSGYHDDTLKRYYGEEMLDLIQSDRKAVYTSDLLRSLIYVFLAALTIWLFLKEKVKQNIMVILLGLFLVSDLVGVNLRYVNAENFVAKRRMTRPFQETPADMEILKDTTYFRVFDQTQGFEGARTSYFHKTISGYHAAKPAGMEDLFYFHIAQGNIGILNMLNIKYVVQQDEEGRSYPVLNPDAHGNAWFVEKLLPVEHSNAEILALDSLDTKRRAVVNSAKFPNVNRFNFIVDSTASITLTDYEPNHLTYKSKNSRSGAAVFSEMYYPWGWNAYVDGKRKKHFRVNYVLRALMLPEGEHTIEFKFEPEIVAVGSQITLASSILLGLVILGGLGFTFWSSRKKENITTQ